MKKLYVYADFDWLKEMELVGELGYESLRGSDSYSFSFHDEWLRKHGNMFLSEDLNLSRDAIYAAGERCIRVFFGCFAGPLGPDLAFAPGADNCVGRRSADTTAFIV